MDDVQAYYCIGGPLDGLMAMSPDYEGFLFFPLAGYWMGDAYIPTDIFVYELESVKIITHTRFLWCAHGWTAAQATTEYIDRLEKGEV